MKYRYLPFIVYSLFLLTLWVASWLVGIAGFFARSGETLNTLFSGEGVRWALYTALQSVDAAPWGTIVLLLTASGVFVASGLPSTIIDVILHRRLSIIRRYAGMLSLAIFALFVLLIFSASVAPWHILAGVTEDWSNSSIVQGCVPVLFLVSLAVSLMHGSVCGYYRSVSDVVHGLCSLFPLFAPAFPAILPATGIIPCIEYVGLFNVDDAELYSDVLCWLPFVYIAVVESVVAIKRYIVP